MIETDQCMFGAETRKGTGIGGNLLFIRHLRRRCGHRFHAGRSRGQVQGVFLSKATATYPSELCRVLAGLHINAYAERIRFASDFSGPLDVPGYVGERGILRSGLVKLSLVGPLRDVWPESEAGCFLAFAAEAGVT